VRLSRRRQDAEEPAAEDKDGEELCLRCQGEMEFVGEQDFHEGTRAWGFVLGDLGELFTGGTKLGMYACKSCGYVEFFIPMRG
jgi:hypothetical protein